MTDRPAVGRRERLAVASLTVVFVLVLLLFAVVTKPYDAADEMAHFDAVMQLALGNGWGTPGTVHVLDAVRASVTSPSAATATWGDLLRAYPGASDPAVDQMTQHPPTYYLVAAGLLHLIGFRDLLWSDAFLAVRLLDVAIVAALPVIAWATVRRLTRSARGGVVAAAAVLLVPQIAVVGSVVTNDAPVLLLAGLVTLVTVRVLTGDDRRRTLVLLVLLLGALVWVKGTGLPAVPFVLVAVFVAGRRVSWRRALVRTVAVGAGTALVGAWWWLQNIVVFGRLQPDGFVGRTDQSFPKGQGPDLAEFVQVSWDTITRTFWGSSGHNAGHAVSPVLSDVATVLTVVVLVAYAFRRGRTLVPAVVLAVFPLLLILLQTATTWSSYLRTTGVNGTQGRYYFPALIALIALSALAWRRLPRTDAGRGRLASGLVVTSLVVAAYGVWFQWRVSWEGGTILVTRGGMDAYADAGPVPGAVVLVLVVLLGVGAVVAGGLALRVTGGTATTCPPDRPAPSTATSTSASASSGTSHSEAPR
ncbi:glycosyltransferase family 39 protein [Curtobacterium sp. VKM Ac-2922]|uniref:glycosyltransferase family 39 protein n=1 Tax=Curtobacterium sp. VKM Ac-2922 TaxID=2929475 RepID=UPI001FB35319|nr:glycosyltransferase family 39 protein [Curtobacterium sp. VKM Ac-2922]MCJ1713372.1 glycosyltransferase family 39 protein [Curtobacterium sp. VKM Ac-2922]